MKLKFRKLGAGEKVVRKIVNYYKMTFQLTYTLLERKRLLYVLVKLSFCKDL